MSKLKKILAAVTAVMTLAVSGVSVSALNITTGNGGSSYSSSDIVKTFTENGRTTDYSISDSGISIYQHAERNGIVFQLKKGADINSLGLKYDFEHKSSVSPGGWCYEFDWYYTANDTGRADFDADGLYVYLADNDTSEEELISYAQELSEQEGVLYADEFNLTVYDSGYVENSAKGNCCLYINTDKDLSNEDMERYVKKLNSNKELISYLESIGADKKITIDKTYKMPRISGIDDNTRIFEIMEELRAFDDVDSASFICAMLLTPRYGIKMAEHKDKADSSAKTEDTEEENTNVQSGEVSDDTAVTPKGLVVTGMYDNGVLLDYDIYLSNDEFKQMSGTDYRLKYGDVITTNCTKFYVTLPEQFCIEEDTYAKYIGTVTEIYKDSIKDLTVTKKDSYSGSFDLQDSSGNTYSWVTNLPYTSAFFGDKDKCEFDIEPREINVGDVLSCAVSDSEFGKKVIAPVSVVSKGAKADTPDDNTADTAEAVRYVLGDANHDDKVNVRDCAFIATAVATKTTDSLPASADFNEDGYKNIRDAAAIAHSILFVNNKHLFNNKA